MEIRFNQADVIGELSLSQGVIERRTTIPALGNVKIEALPDGKVKITATDLEVGLESTFDATVKTPGSLLMPATKAYRYLAELPAGAPINLKTTDTGVILNSGRSRAKFPLYGEDNFPALPEPGELVATVSAQQFSYGLSTVAFAISNEESRFTISGAFIQLNAKGIIFAATDGHRLGVSTYEIPFPGIDKARKVVIPTKAANEIMKLASKADKDATIDIHISDNCLHFRIGNHLLYSRTNTQKFPDYERVFITGKKLVLKTDSNVLRSAVSRVANFADDRSKAIRLIVDGESSCVNFSIANAQNGEGDESVDVEFPEGPHSYEVGIRSDYVSDFLRIAAGKPVFIYFKENARMVEFGIEGDSTYRHTIATMTI